MGRCRASVCWAAGTAWPTVGGRALGRRAGEGGSGRSTAPAPVLRRAGRRRRLRGVRLSSCRGFGSMRRDLHPRSMFLISDGGETEVDASFVVDVTQPQHPGTRREERRPRSFIASGAEDLGEVGVGEAAVGGGPVTQGEGVGVTGAGGGPVR